MDSIIGYLSFSGAVKLLLSYINSGKKPDKAEYVGSVSELYIYPVKSMRRIPLQMVECTHRGVKYPGEDLFDRNFMVTDENGIFVHARTIPKMSTIKVIFRDTWIRLECDGMPALKLPAEPDVQNANVVSTKVWFEEVEGHDCGDEAAEWINKCLNKRGLRVLYGADGIMNRKLNIQEESFKQLCKDEDYVTYQDGYPYMLTTTSSVDELNTRMSGETFDMSRFRPNIVVSGSKAWDEDDWKEIWIGEAKFTNMKPCQRCIMTTIDPDKGVKHPNGEPLATLAKYRLDEPNFGKSPLLGINLVLDNLHPSSIRVGDAVYILKKKKVPTATLR